MEESTLVTELALVYIALLIAFVAGIIVSSPRTWQGRDANIVIISIWVVGLALSVGTLITR